MRKKHGDSEIQAVHLGKWVHDDQKKWLVGYLKQVDSHLSDDWNEVDSQLISHFPGISKPSTRAVIPIEDFFWYGIGPKLHWTKPFELDFPL